MIDFAQILSSTQMTDPTPVTIYDEAFTIKTQRWGTFVSQDLEGKPLITSLSEKGCEESTRWYLKAKQDGFEPSEKCYDASVGGKL